MNPSYPLYLCLPEKNVLKRIKSLSLLRQFEKGRDNQGRMNWLGKKKKKKKKKELKRKNLRRSVEHG